MRNPSSAERNICSNQNKRKNKLRQERHHERMNSAGQRIPGAGICRPYGAWSVDSALATKVPLLMELDYVVFQCKRWQRVVGSADIRDFRGAMVGRADKGLFITTSSFSRDALKEAVRDGAPPIDLIDGDQLAEKLKELKSGVVTELIENVSVNGGWFREI